MPEHELEKLLGGFATETLTAEERRLLFTAALRDQQLFNALADEQALKELLADPAVRRRLLEAVTGATTSASGGSSWLDWFRGPAGLAFAGGLAAAVFAVILGTRIYQDSLKQAAQTVATDTPTAATSPPPASEPASPQVAEPQPRDGGNAVPMMERPKKDHPSGTLSKPERSARLHSQEQRDSGPGPQAFKQGAEQEPMQRRTEKSVDALRNRDDNAAGSQSRGSTAPPVSAPEIKPLQAPANAPAARMAASGLSARTLFYGKAQADERERRSLGAAHDDLRSGNKGMTAPLKEQKRSDPSTGLLGKLEGHVQSAGTPLGVRYSLIMSGPGGIDMEVEPTTPVGKDDAPRLAIQTNEAGYLSVLSTRPPSEKQTILFPSSGDGRISGMTPVAIPLASVFDEPQRTGTTHLLIVFSRSPMHAGAMPPADKNAPHLLIEQVNPGQPGSPTEQAVYIVNPAAAPTAFVSFEISLALHP